MNTNYSLTLKIRVINFSPHTGDYQGQVQGQEEQSCRQGWTREISVGDHAVPGHEGRGDCQVGF